MILKSDDSVIVFFMPNLASNPFLAFGVILTHTIKKEAIQRKKEEEMFRLKNRKK
jgi:hypothetical protein